MPDLLASRCALGATCLFQQWCYTWLNYSLMHHWQIFALKTDGRPPLAVQPWSQGISEKSLKVTPSPLLYRRRETVHDRELSSLWLWRTGTECRLPSANLCYIQCDATREARWAYRHEGHLRQSMWDLTRSTDLRVVPNVTQSCQHSQCFSFALLLLFYCSFITLLLLFFCSFFAIFCSMTLKYEQDVKTWAWHDVKKWAWR